MLRDGAVPLEIEWENMVLIPKGKGGYRAIGLVEVLWKVCAVVVNFWLKRRVVLHDTLHRFRAGRGTGRWRLNPSWPSIWKGSLKSLFSRSSTMYRKPMTCCIGSGA